MSELLVAQYLNPGLSPLHARDLLVAAVSFCLGLNIIYVTLTDHPFCYRLNSVQTLQRHWGLKRTRLLLFAVGVACLTIAAFLAIRCGFDITRKRVGPIYRDPIAQSFGIGKPLPLDCC